MKQAVLLFALVSALFVACDQPTKVVVVSKSIKSSVAVEWPLKISKEFFITTSNYYAIGVSSLFSYEVSEETYFSLSVGDVLKFR